MIPFYDFKRELKCKRETMTDIFCAVLYSTALIAGVIALIMSIVKNNSVMIVWCSIFMPNLAVLLAWDIVWAVKDYKKYNLVREMNETALEFMLLDITIKKLSETVEELEKEGTTKATKTTIEKKTTRKRK